MFLLSQNDENQSENGSKNSKIRLRARPPAEPQKKMLQTKKLRSKSWKTRGSFTFHLPILDGRVHEQVSSVLFFTVFFEGERHDLSKTGGFGRKMPPPPPGKPVTFYECHPDDHAPAPSVRADFHFTIFDCEIQMFVGYCESSCCFPNVLMLQSNEKPVFVQVFHLTGVADQITRFPYRCLVGNEGMIHNHQ